MKQYNHLDKIIHHKQQEINRLLNEIDKNPRHQLSQLMSEPKKSSKKFSSALKRQGLTVIGEVKRKSPTAGTIGVIQDPAKLALEYCSGGASVISVLTDEEYFGGSLSDLRNVADSVATLYPETAILRKDFIIHPLQLAEAIEAGAHAVLFIVNVVGKRLKILIDEAHRLGLETLTEIHNRSELDLALEAEAPNIGINHRNLETFEIDLGISDKLRPLIPPHIITVAESGIHEPRQAKLMRDLGYDAILVGEALVRSKNPSELIRQLQGG